MLMMFPGRSEVVPIRTQRVPQTIETPVSFVAVPNAYVRYAYARSSDSMASQVEGQDYLCFQHNDQRLVFVVCDGVGSSFCGNLAARILGDALLEWMWALDITYLGGAAALAEAATGHLNRIQKHAQHEVAEYQIPETISGLVRQALEAQRAYGSETIFAAARIDHPSATIPEGLVSVCWMGDTQIHVLDEEGNPLDLGGEWNNANRWSTAQGVRGRLSAWMHELQGIRRLVAFTDGLTAHAARLMEYSDGTLDREIRAGALLPSSDDVAFIDVVVRTPRYEGYPDPQLPDPNAERPWLEQIWNPSGGGTYELRWNWSGSERDRFVIQEATNPALIGAHTIEVTTSGTTWRPSTPRQPGHYYYRVRAVRRHGGLTPWSELRQTKVVYPPPPAPALHLTEADRPPVLEWHLAGEALDYILEQATDPSFEETEVVYSGRGTSWVVPVGAIRPGTYYYRVRAISDGGPGPWSEAQKVEIQAPPPPRPHLALTSYGYDPGSYELRWQPVPGAVRYELQQIERDSGAEVTFPLKETIYRVVGQPVGEYIYRVRACSEFACSEWSNEQRASVMPQAPSEAPALTLEGPDENGAIRLHWTEVPTADQYVVEISEDSAFQNARLTVQPDRTLELLRREPGVQHFRVCGQNEGGDGPWSNIVSAALAPGTPGWIEARLAEEAGRISVSWGMVSGRATYCLEVEASSAYTTTRQEIYRGPDTRFEMAIPPEIETLTFRVRAELPGVHSDWQTGDPIRIKAAPDAPRLEPPEIDEHSVVRLRWTQVAGATHYILEAAREEEFANPHSATPLDRTEVAFRAPTSGRYWFRVRAGHHTGVSGPSNIFSIRAPRPAPPQLWSHSPARAQSPFEVSWKGLPGSVYYELQESTDPAFEASATQTRQIFHPAQKLTIPKRPAGKRYFRVRVFDEQNEPSLWSDVLAIDIE